MIRPLYVCEGTCGAEVNPIEYKNGKTTCASESCSHYGKTFVKKYVCDSCKETVEAIHTHECKKIRA
jgi:hypothetical protein